MGLVLRNYAVDIESKRVRHLTTGCQIISAAFFLNTPNVLPRNVGEAVNWEAIVRPQLRIQVKRIILLKVILVRQWKGYL